MLTENRGWRMPFSPEIWEDTPMRLLLVEDDARIARFVSKGLQEQSYAVDVVANGKDAIYQVEVNDYDVLILDVMIPGLDGFSTCRAIRSAGKRMPVLMLTARDGVDDRIHGLDSGADDYLTKPFALSELVARVRALGRRTTGVPLEHVLSYSDLQLDLITHEVHRAACRIELTPKEFALLECFLRHPRQVLSRSQIADQVWGYDFDSFSNVVDVYVRYLRNKLEVCGAPPIIHTLRGAGYRLWDEKLERRKLER